jgi:hypothetical protein
MNKLFFLMIDIICKLITLLVVFTSLCVIKSFIAYIFENYCNEVLQILFAYGMYKLYMYFFSNEKNVFNDNKTEYEKI